MIKIAIINFHGLGDLVMACGSMAMLKRAIPQSEITLFTFKENQPLAQMIDGVDKFIYESASSFKSINILTKLLPRIVSWRKTKYDLIISCQVAQKQNWFFSFLKKDKFLCPGRDPLTDIVSAQGNSFAPKMNHYTEAYPKLFSAAAESLGAKTDLKVDPLLHFNTSALELNVFKKLKELQIERGQYIAVAPGGGTNFAGDKTITRQYPHMGEAFAMAIKRIPQAQIVLLGAKSDIKQCSKVAASLGENVKHFNSAGLTSLSEYVTLIDQCLFLVTNDSSALHIATARKKPVIVIFGPTDYQEKVYPTGNIFVFNSPKPAFIHGQFKGGHKNESYAISCFDDINPQDISNKIIEYTKVFTKKD
jgi:ADP-heptose:LPS heptosyltransferase